jgi:hypothetical protein
MDKLLNTMADTAAARATNAARPVVRSFMAYSQSDCVLGIDGSECGCKDRESGRVKRLRE